MSMKTKINEKAKYLECKKFSLIILFLHFQGVTKRMKISRRVVAGDGTAKKEEKVNIF